MSLPLQVGARYLVADTTHGRFLDRRIGLGDTVEVEGINAYGGVRVATLLFPELPDRSTGRACREYVALSRDPELWLERCDGKV